MSTLVEQVARRLTRFYVLALTVIALLTVSGMLFVRQTIGEHNDDSRVLNVAGRQRMLSQRLTKLAVLRTTGLPASDTASFPKLLSNWAQNHLQLQKGMLVMEKNYAVRKSPRLDSMFARLDPYFQSMHRNFLRIDDALSTPDIRRQALANVLRDESYFLRQMDDIVFQFDAESAARVNYLERIEWILGLATLLTVLLEGLFIFRPVVNHTKSVIRRLTESETALRQANTDLEAANRQVVKAQADLLRATEEKYELQRAEDRVRTAALMEGQEEERRRFARELHDGVGQMLTGLNLHAQKLKSVPLPDEKQRQRFRELCDMIQEIIQTTREISHNMMPSALHDFGLGPSLQYLAEQTGRSSGITVTFSEEGSGPRPDSAVETGVYRIAQEALNNALKYANARTIRIVLCNYTTELLLRVEDDGAGFVPSFINGNGHTGATTTRAGLENMRTRARLLNGDLNIISKPGAGTTVSVFIDLSDTSSA